MNVFILVVLVLMYAGIIAVQDKKAWISLGAALVLVIGGLRARAMRWLAYQLEYSAYLSREPCAGGAFYLFAGAGVSCREIVERSPSVG